jgi:putative SOS response-associated peptidase YedK
MPVILPEQHHAAWLGETDDGNLKALLLPYPADQTTSPNSVHYPLGALTPQPR